MIHDKTYKMLRSFATRLLSAMEPGTGWESKLLFSLFFRNTLLIKIQGGFLVQVQVQKKLIWARLDVSGTIYVNVDSPYLGCPYFIGDTKIKIAQIFEIRNKK